MIEIENLFMNNSEKRRNISMSLFGKLEAIVGNYFLSEITNGVFRGLWNTVYFDPNIDCEIECVECIPENLIGYVDRENRWAFILDKYLKKFKEDTAEYELEYIGVPSLQEKILQCSHTDHLPCGFAGILWMDDDFMNDADIPFDFDAFAIIEEGREYINPKHFSVHEFVKNTQ